MIYAHSEFNFGLSEFCPYISSCERDGIVLD